MSDDIYTLPEVEITEEEERIFDDGESLILCLSALEIRVLPDVLEKALGHLEVTPAQLPALLDFAARRKILVAEEYGCSVPAPTPRMLGAMILSRAEQCGIRLHDRERQALRFRFGLEDGIPHTLDETALHFGTSRERIRWIECRTFRRYFRAGLRARSRKQFFA